VPAVAARELRKSFGSTVALDGLDLTVERGTVHGLLGSNGAGKSTLLRILLGLVGAESGRLEVPGTVGGFVEAPGAYPYLTGRQNLELLAALDDRPGDVEQVLGRVDLLDRADSKVGGWSLGMRQRLGIAAGLLRRPDLLVLDEPANGLDLHGARALRELIRELAADGLTVLLCSHDLAEVDALCSAVTVIATGRSVWSGPIGELRARPGSALLTSSDDAAATRIAAAQGLAVTRHPDGALSLSAGTADLDRYVLALAREGVAVRSLVRAAVPLEQALLDLAP
jgi:ABC-2 type transport system ATP-binding protein